MEFNPDGSVRLPDELVRQKQEKEDRMKKGRCMVVRKDVLSTKPPKTCMLHIMLSDAIDDNRFVETIFQQLNEKSQTPFKLTKVNEKQFDIEVGTEFRRCSDCSELVRRFKEFLYSNVIEEKQDCPYEGSPRERNFCYEDYFD
ncbi:hypothetical protein GF345_05145 [Candidatus Woesearchaeota archaeon]|nr:hypothetical protein [Candidatus Woesearchaeota archaeon]